MGSNSTSPFHDVSRCPDRTALLIPKPEPKTEPFDEPGPSSRPPFHFPDPSSADPPAGGEFFSDYNRLAELFHCAFPHPNGAVPEPEHPDSRALVPVPNPPQTTGARRHQTRSAELVRVENLGPEGEHYHRAEMRRTRMVYDSLRVFLTAADERRRDLNLLEPNRRTRADLKSAAALRERDLWLNREKRVVGRIPGIEIGDVYLFRMEMCVLGLHGQAQAGIDYVPSTQSSNGEPVATSIIVSGGYEDDEDGGDKIIYTGHGGQDKHGRQIAHQKLECGNLALERSSHYEVEVRVIRGFRYEGSVSGKVYVYDGLYKIEETWFDVGKSGLGVFKFKIVRIENQEPMGSAVMRLALDFKTRPLEARPRGLVSLDISGQKENLPVFCFNDVDGANDPIFYDYLRSSTFPPHVYGGGAPVGCDCIGGCHDNCFCAMKNGGEFAYDLNGTLVRGKPLVFECGPHCRCPPTCRNRVAQKGMKNRFEVFRSRETGWGVRSLDLVPAGAFICEYAGVVLTREQSQILTMNGDSLVYAGRFGDRWKEWGNLSQVFADYVVPSRPSIPPLDFAMDVSRMRNVACYMSHSSIPNAFVQPVLYDHNNMSFPRLMVFAMENIPPMREISLDYGVADEFMGKPRLAICN